MSLRDAMNNRMHVLYDQHGHLTPRLVLEDARPKDSPLHPAVFDRNQKDAAEAYYLDRAHQLLRSFYITVRPAKPEDPDLRVRKWHAVATEDGHIYRAAEDIAEDPTHTAIVLKDMERQWRELYRRYGQFQEFIDLVRSTTEAAA